MGSHRVALHKEIVKIKYMWKYYNPNPHNKSTGDCVIRAITKVIGADWDTVYVLMCAEGFLLKELPSTDNVWRSFLSKNGFHRYMVHDAVIGEGVSSGTPSSFMR